MHGSKAITVMSWHTSENVRFAMMKWDRTQEQTLRLAFSMVLDVMPGVAVEPIPP